MQTPGTVHEFCRMILESGELRSKLLPPRCSDGQLLVDNESAPALLVDAPVRSAQLQMRSGADKLPRLQELRDPAARRVCIERFANHELMAIELFAWVLLAYPGMPPALRRGLLRVLEEEQGHLQLYLDRLEELGSGLGDSMLSDYFWQQIPGIQRSSDGPLTFLCVMGLTFEQANLDYSLLYRDAFRNAGDEQSAAVAHRIHEDEIRHVGLAATWLGRLAPAGRTDAQVYSEFVPFPLSAARAKARRFDAQARRRAGLSEEMIELVRSARPYKEVRRSPREGAERD